MNIMPEIRLNELKQHLSLDEIQLVEKIIYSKRLRANKPKVSFRKEGYIRIDNMEEAKASYLWAYCAYFISPYKIHGAALPSDRGIFESNRLREIGNMICEGVPKELWFGLISRGER